MEDKPLPRPLSDDVSPWQPGECLCGTPNCAGHKEVNGRISFKDHPDISDGDYELILPSQDKTKEKG